MAAYPFVSAGKTPGEKQPLQPGKLWRNIPHARRLEAAQAFWDDQEAVEQQAEALVAVAQALKFRIKTVRSLPAERKARHLAGIASLPDTVAARVLVAYHLLKQRPMMGAFLDALGIAHDNGLITAEGVTAPDQKALESAAASLRTAFPTEDVDLYFATLVAQDPETWGGLSELGSGQPAGQPQPPGAGEEAGSTEAS